MRWLVWAIPLVVLNFVWALNEALRGQLKEIISGITALLIFFCVGAAFFLSGWKIGIISLVGAFALANAFQPLGLVIARHLVRFPDIGVEAYQKAEYEKMLDEVKEWGSDKYDTLQEKRRQEEENHRDLCVRSAMTRSDIQDVLIRHGATARDLEALYNRVEVISLPPNIRKQVLCNTDLVDWFMRNSEVSESDGEYVRNTKSMDAHLRLLLWASRNPGGSNLGG